MLPEWFNLESSTSEDDLSTDNHHLSGHKQHHQDSTCNYKSKRYKTQHTLPRGPQDPHRHKLSYNVNEFGKYKSCIEGFNGREHGMGIATT
jgi:hypothetical protein